MTTLAAKAMDLEADHTFRAKLMLKMCNKAINPCVKGEKLSRWIQYVNDESLSLLPTSKLYNEEYGRPAWEHVRFGAHWNTLKLPEIPNDTLEC